MPLPSGGPASQIPHYDNIPRHSVVPTYLHHTSLLSVFMLLLANCQPLFSWRVAIVDAVGDRLFFLLGEDLNRHYEVHNCC